MISHRYKFIYIDLPKAGGGASWTGRADGGLRNALLPFCDHDVIHNAKDINFGHSLYHKKKDCKAPNALSDCCCEKLSLENWQHKTVYDHVEKYGIDVVKDYFVFSVIRNPFEKIASALLTEENQKDYAAIKQEHGKEGLQSYIALRRWDDNVSWMYSNLEWITNHHLYGGLSLINFIGYYEKDLSGVFDFIKKRTGLPSGANLQKASQADSSVKQKHYSEFFSEKLREQVWEHPIMKIERKIFNWEFNEA